MAKKTEILEYRAEVGDAKRKISDLGDTEQQTMAKGAKATEGLGDATKGLTKDKEKLASAVRATGGSFSGMIGDLGGVVELMTQGGKAAIGLGAAMAGLALAAKVFSYIREEMRKVVEEEEKIADRFDKLKQRFVDAQTAMADTLQRYGALTPETERAAGHMRRRIERAGFAPETAVGIAPTAVMAGLSPEDAELLAQLSLMGAQVGEPTGAGEMIDRLRKEQPQVVAAAQAQIRRIGKTQTGMDRIAVAEPQPMGPVRATPEQRARRVMITGGYQDWEVEGDWLTPMGFEKHIKLVERLDAEKLEVQAALAKGRPGTTTTSARERIGQLKEKLFELQGRETLRVVRRERQREAEALKGPELPSAVEAGVLSEEVQARILAGVAAVTIINDNRQYVGSQSGVTKRNPIYGRNAPGDGVTRRDSE